MLRETWGVHEKGKAGFQAVGEGGTYLNKTSEKRELADRIDPVTK
jgi:hypothetical protein